MGQPVARAGPGGVQRHPPHHAVVGVLAVAGRGVEGEQEVGTAAPDRPHKLAAQLQRLRQLGVGMAEELHVLRPQHGGRLPLLRLAPGGQGRTLDIGVLGALVP